MIRTAKGGPISSVFNSFHSSTTVTTGFYTNSSSSTDPPPPSDAAPAAGCDWDFSVLGPVPMSQRTLFSGYLAGYDKPFLVSSSYLTLLRNSAGYTCVKSSGYTGSVAFTREEGTRNFVTLNTVPLGIGESFYIRVDDSLPLPRTYNWYKSSSSSGVRDVVCAESSVIVNLVTGAFSAPSSKTLFVTSIYVSDLESPGRVSVNISRDTPNLGTSTPPTEWSGSSLGQGSGGFAVSVLIPY